MKATALTHTGVHKEAIRKIGPELSYSAMKVYMYVNFNPNLAAGESHRLNYDDVVRIIGESHDELRCVQLTSSLVRMGQGNRTAQSNNIKKTKTFSGRHRSGD